MAQETPNDTEISSRHHKKRKRLRPFPVGKVPTSRVSMAAAAALSPLGGAGGRREWALFSRTAAEIDSLGLPEVSTPNLSNHPAGARPRLRIKSSCETRGNIRRRRGRSENHTQASGAASEAAGERGEAGGGAARGVSLQILFAMVTSYESPRGTEHSMTRFFFPLFHFNSY